MSERGSASVLVTAGVVVAVLVGLVVLDAARLAAAKVAAQTAADAAALAAAPATFGLGASTPQAEAARWAERNGARLVGCGCPIDLVWRSRVVAVEVEVEVDPGILGVDSVYAGARAEFDPTVWLEEAPLTGPRPPTRTRSR